jgi:hypothetical protein
MRKPYGLKICCKCEKKYQPTGSRQMFCRDCMPTKKERSAQWDKDNPEQKQANTKRNYEENKERILAKNKKWFGANPEKSLGYRRKYEHTHKEERRGPRQTLEQRAASDKRWAMRHPDEVISRNARRRKLGFVPMNQRFEGSAPHHIDTERVIYIPKSVHRSIPHCVWTGKNMAKINAEAFNFLFKQEVTNA